MSEKEGMVWESDPFKNRYPCSECNVTNTYTRIYRNDKIMDARFLCFNCSCDYVEKKGYRELILPFLKSSDLSVTTNGVASPTTQCEE